MKMPDEIKKGLSVCMGYAECCAICPYYHDKECQRDIKTDALAYIQQLEAERDALRDGLKVELGCYVCKHYVDDPDYDSNECMSCGKNRCNFEWRGVQKEE